MGARTHQSDWCVGDGSRGGREGARGIRHDWRSHRVRFPRGAPRSPGTDRVAAAPAHGHVQLRRRPAREPRRHRVLRALRGADALGRRRGRRAVRDRRAVRARRRPAHGRDRRRLGRARRHVTAVLRGQAVRGGARARRRAELVRRVPPAAHRRVRRVRAQARAGRAHRGQRREPRPQAVPQPRRRRRRASSRTTCSCCCAARSCGARAKARPATARGVRSAARRTPCCATRPNAS